MYRILDTFCKAGGATKGYQEAGFYVVGVDIDPQPNYCGNEFHQGDAFEYIREHWMEFDAIHASPMCQRYSVATPNTVRENYPDQLGPIEDLLMEIGKPFIIENVEMAPFRLPTLTLCGIQFGLNVIRHRKFAVNFPVLKFEHNVPHPVRGEFVTCAGHGGNGSNRYSDWAEAMGIDWMTKQELASAIPPRYTKYIGTWLMVHLNRQKELYGR